jgi:hypothetical protein
LNAIPTLPSYSSEALAALGPPGLADLMVRDEDRVPRNVVIECARRGEAMVEHLSGLPEDDRYWNGEGTPGEWWLLLHAVMILGLIPGERAGLLLLRFMRRMGQEEDDNLQGWLSGYWPALFRNKPLSVFPALRALCEDRSLGWYIRSNAVDAVVAGARGQGAPALDEALAWAATLAADEQEDWDFRLCVGNTLLDFPRPEYRPLLEDLAQRQTGRGVHFSGEEVRRAYSAVENEAEWERRKDPWRDFYAPAAIERRQERWEEEDADSDGDEREGEDALPEEAPLSYVRATPKVGRNDPCPCGSGKKYKHCCMKQDGNVETSPEDPAWRRLRRAIEPLPADLLRFAEGYFGRAGLMEAWDEFTLWEDAPFDAASPHIPVFMPWFYYDWMPDPRDTEVRAEARGELSAAQAYLLRKGKSLDPLARRYIEACVAAPFSFYDVLASTPGRGFTLRDIITGEECGVTERSASRSVTAGDILFAKIVRLEGLALLEACGTVVIPPERKGPILELRKRIRASELPLFPGAPAELGMEMLAVYHGIADTLLNPAFPELRNTDGDPLGFHKLVFEIESPRAAFDALKDLALDEDEAALLEEAEFNRQGALRRVHFSWKTRGNPVHKGWDNTVLGTLTIDAARLVAEVNSEARAQRIRKIVEERLGAKVKHLATEIQSAQSMLARVEAEGGSGPARAMKSEHDRLAALPEVQARIAEMMRAHCENWVSEKIPALGGKTPLQAVKDPEGREMVEALVLQMERRGRTMTPPLEPAIIRELRARLGLA